MPKRRACLALKDPIRFERAQLAKQTVVQRAQFRFARALYYTFPGGIV